MREQKLQHMNENTHYKMYKAGKLWLFAGIVGLSLGAAMTVPEVHTVKADATTTSSKTNTDDNTTQASAVIRPASVASQTSTSVAVSTGSVQSAVSLVAKTTDNPAANMAVQSDTANVVKTNTPSSETSASTATTSLANVTSQPESTQPVSQQPISVASTSNVDNADPTTGVKPDFNSVAPSVTLDTKDTESDTKQNSDTSQQTLAAGSILKQTASNSATQTSTKVTPPIETSTVSTLPTQSVTSDIQTTKVTSQIDSAQFVKGTQVSTANDGTLKVSLPAGASEADIQQAKTVIQGAHVDKARVIAKDGVISDIANYANYTQGAKTALSDLSNGFWSGAGYDISDWIGTKTGEPDFTADYAKLQKVQLESNTSRQDDLTILDKNVREEIGTWVTNVLTKIDETSVFSSTAYKTMVGMNIGLSDNSTFVQEGYTDAIKNFVKGELTTEAYYLWKVISTDNTDDSLYYGTEGYSDVGVDLQNNKLVHFATALNTLNTFSTNTDTSDDVTHAYDAGRAMILSWVTGDINEENEIKALLSADPTDGPYDSNTTGMILLSEISAALLGHTATGGAAPVNIQYDFNSTGIVKSTFISYAAAEKAFKTPSNFAGSIYDQISGTSTNGFNNLTDLEADLVLRTLRAYYDEWENVVNEAFKDATKDALAGRAIALNYSPNYAVVTKLPIPKEYKDNAFQTKIYLTAYQSAKSYLSGFETTNGKDGFSYGQGNTSLDTASGIQNVPSPLDLAIYSVLTGKTYTYNTAANSINTAGGIKAEAIVGTRFQSAGYPDPDDPDNHADWIATAAQNDMYQVAWDTANQAKMDFLSDVQLLVNAGQTAKLANTATFLPTASSHGVLSDSQYDDYQQNSYVYYKVFSILYKSFFLDKNGSQLLDANGQPTNMIAKALTEADAHVIQSGNANAGKPQPWNVQQAQNHDPSLVAATNGRNFTLNADMTNGVSQDKDGTLHIIPYSEDDVPSSDVNGQATTKPVDTSTLLKNAVDATSTINSDDLGASITGSSEINNAQKVIQDTINYAYVHEEAVATPAYEAGYAAVQKALNPMPKYGQPAVGNPTADSYQYANTSTVTDTLTPVFATTNPDGSTVWTIRYSDADGTNALVTIKRTANQTPKLGTVTSIKIDVTDAQTGKQVADSGDVAPTAITGGNGVQASYASLKINHNVPSDGFTKLSITANADGSVNYVFVRTAQSEVPTVLDATGQRTVSDGTSAGNVYQAGWDYRKSYVSEMTLVQQIADPNYSGTPVNGKATNRLVADQTYAGFFGEGMKNGAITPGESAVELNPNATFGQGYGTIQQKMTLLDKSSVDLTIDANGTLTYSVFDTKGNQTGKNATGTIKAGDAAVTITNQDAPRDASQQLQNGYTDSFVTITYAKDGSLNVSETGIQTVMQNSIQVDNAVSTKPTNDNLIVETDNHAQPMDLLADSDAGNKANATAEVGINGSTVEPEYISKTLVALMGLVHKGIVFTPDVNFPKDNKYGTDGTSSQFDQSGEPNTNGLIFQGTTPNVADDQQSPSTYLGTATNTTTTIQYVASDIENENTGITASAGVDAKGGAKVVINLNGQSTSAYNTKDANGNIVKGVPVDKTTNVGPEIFDWAGWYTAHQTDLNNAGWTYDASAKQLTYDPTDLAAQQTLHQQLYGRGFDPNWVSDAIGKITSLKDQYGDVMHLSINTQQTNRQTVTKTVNPATVLNSDGQSFKISTDDITKAAKDESTPGLTVAQLKTFANGQARSFAADQLKDGLPDGFKSITVNADGSITVVLKSDVKAGTVTRALPLSFITDNSSTDGDVLNTTGKDADGKTVSSPLSSLTLDLTLQSANEIKYYVEGTTTAVPGSGTLAKSTDAGTVGETYSEAAPTITGYTLTSDKTLTGTYSATPTDLIFYYKADASTVTVNYYVKGTTTKITPSKTLNGYVDGAYASETATVTGYTLVATPTDASGKYVAGGSTVDYYYTVDYKVVPVTSAGTPLIGTGVTTPTGTGKPGDPIAPNGGLPQISGYTLTTTPNVPDKPGNVNAVYTPVTENVVVNYYVQGTTTPVTGSVTLSGPFGSSYQTTGKTIPGYTLVTTPSNAKGTYGVINGAVTYEYVENVTVVSVDQHGHTIPNVPAKVITGVPGQSIPVSELPKVPGYTPVVSVVNVPGQPGRIEVTYVPNTPASEPQQPLATTKAVRTPMSVTPIATSPVKVAAQPAEVAYEPAAVVKTAPVHVVTLKTTSSVQHKQSTTSEKAVVLPHTGERDSLMMVIAGLSLMVSCFVFVSVRKYRQQ